MISSAETSGDIGVKLESESACESRPGTKAFYFLEPKCLNRHSLFCGVGSRVEMESDDAGSGFTGRLDKFPLLDVIQMACVAQRDGRLHIIHESDQGEVLLEKGQIFHAQTAQRNGEDALLEILCWRDGRFTFSPIIPRTLRKQSIAAHWQYALMDAVRKRDEKAHAGELSEEGKRAAATVLSPHPRSSDFIRNKSATAPDRSETRIDRRSRRGTLVCVFDCYFLALRTTSAGSRIKLSNDSKRDPRKAFNAPGLAKGSTT